MKMVALCKYRCNGCANVPECIKDGVLNEDGCIPFIRQAATANLRPLKNAPRHLRLSKSNPNKHNYGP